MTILPSLDATLNALALCNKIVSPAIQHTIANIPPPFDLDPPLYLANIYSPPIYAKSQYVSARMVNPTLTSSQGNLVSTVVPEMGFERMSHAITTPMASPSVFISPSSALRAESRQFSPCGPQDYSYQLHTTTLASEEIYRLLMQVQY